MAAAIHDFLAVLAAKVNIERLLKWVKSSWLTKVAIKQRDYEETSHAKGFSL
jgi:hypothetical protein